MSKKPLLACLSLALLTACRAPAILGGPTRETTNVDCGDGTTCPLAYPNCPPPFSRPYGGKCEAQQWSGPEMAERSDAGVGIRCVCAGGMVGWWCGQPGRCECADSGDVPACAGYRRSGY